MQPKSLARLRSSSVVMEFWASGCLGLSRGERTTCLLLQIALAPLSAELLVMILWKSLLPCVKGESWEHTEQLTDELRFLSISTLILSSAIPPDGKSLSLERSVMLDLPLKLWHNEEGQDIAEYAVLLAVILVLVVGTIRLVGTNANNVFSSVASTVQ
jgi:Flp pilus assembly pilin Flp